MKIIPKLEKARFLKRYKRFLADVVLESGEQITVHCPNTGSMKNCQFPDSECWISLSPNLNRKYPYTWEIASVEGGHKAGINTARANSLVVEAIQNGVVKELAGYQQLRTEVRYGEERSRIDILLEDHKRREKQQCYVEVKNVTLCESDGNGSFPDAVTERGQKHLRELIFQHQQGARAVLFFCVQHSGINSVAPADSIDPTYGLLLREAVKKGVEVLAYRAEFTADEITLNQKLPINLS